MARRDLPWVTRMIKVNANCQSQVFSLSLVLYYHTTLSLSFFFFWPPHTAFGVLVPRPGINHMPLALEAWSLIHWIIREIHTSYFYHCSFLKAESTVTQMTQVSHHGPGNFDDWPSNPSRTAISSFFGRAHGLCVASGLLQPLRTSSNRRLWLDDPNKQSCSLKTFSFQD